MPVTSLSGLRQRASLMVGLVRPFRLLLLDEPFATLDVDSAQLVARCLAGEVSRGATVIVSSHQRELLPGAARCLALRDGAITYDGPLADYSGSEDEGHG